MKIEVNSEDFFNRGDIEKLQGIASNYYDTTFNEAFIRDIEHSAAWSDERCTMMKNENKRSKVSPSKREMERALESLENTATKLIDNLEKHRGFILDNIRFNAYLMAFSGDFTKPIKEAVNNFDKELTELIENIKDLSRIFQGNKATVKFRERLLKKSGGKEIDERAYLALSIMTIFDYYKFEHNDEIILEVLKICLGAALKTFNDSSEYGPSKLEKAVNDGRCAYEVNKTSLHEAYFGVKFPFTEK